MPYRLATRHQSGRKDLHLLGSYSAVAVPGGPHLRSLCSGLNSAIITCTHPCGCSLLHEQSIPKPPAFGRTGAADRAMYSQPPGIRGRGPAPRMAYRHFSALSYVSHTIPTFLFGHRVYYAGSPGPMHRLTTTSRRISPAPNDVPVLPAVRLVEFILQIPSDLPVIC